MLFRRRRLGALLVMRPPAAPLLAHIVITVRHCSRALPCSRPLSFSLFFGAFFGSACGSGTLDAYRRRTSGTQTNARRNLYVKYAPVVLISLALIAVALWAAITRPWRDDGTERPTCRTRAEWDSGFCDSHPRAPPSPPPNPPAEPRDQRLEDIADELVVNEYWLLPTTYISICFVGSCFGLYYGQRYLSDKSGSRRAASSSCPLC